MQQTTKEQAIRGGGPERAQEGLGPRGPMPTAEDWMTEFAAEPGFRPAGCRSRNTRVHKS